jgi:hypothetical protein
MLNSSSVLGSYADVRSRVLQRLNAAHIDDHLFELIQAAYASALAEENLVLSSVEKRRLLADVLKSVLEHMNRRLVD